MRADIIHGNVFDVLPTIKAGSVDCAVTSPPYWMLRSYLPKGHEDKHLELGSERTPAEFVANMVRVFGLVRDCLADHGTCWVNVGDTYGGSGAGGGGNRKGNEHGQHDAMKGGRAALQQIDAGNLCLIPQRLAIALQDDGWLVRSIVVWHKPSCMPASLSGWSWRRCRVKVKHCNGRIAKVAATGGNHRSVASFKDERSESGAALSAEDRPQWTDCPGCKKCSPNGGYVLRRGSWRPTSSYEPIMMLAKSSKYFCDGESVKTPTMASSLARVAQNNGNPIWNTDRERDHPDSAQTLDINQMVDPNGANLRDVWTIASEPLRQKHYAAFPSELARRCLKAGTSARGYCPACGGPWVRVIEARAGEVASHNGSTFTNGKTGHTHGERVGQGERTAETATLGWRPSCSCPPAEPRPGLVLDPFVGSGRTAIVAGELGLDFVGAELNEEYVTMARKLTRERMPLFLEPT